jgi:hypothetical protein
MPEDPPKPGILASGLRQAQETLAELPPGARGALIAQATTKGVRMGVAMRVADSWTIVGDFEQPWEGKPEGKVTVVKQW